MLNSGPGKLADAELGQRPLIGEAGDPHSGDQCGELLANERILGHPEVAGHLDEASHRSAGRSHRASRPDRSPFVHQRREGDGPAAVDVTEAMVVGNAHLVEEHLVEACAAGHLAQRADLHARGVHVDDESGEALVLGQVGVRAGDDLADVGVLGARGPHLLSGDHPLVAVTFGAHLQAGEIATGAWLGEQLAGDDVAAPQRTPDSAAWWRRRRGPGSSERSSRDR